MDKLTYNNSQKRMENLMYSWKHFAEMAEFCNTMFSKGFNIKSIKIGFGNYGKLIEDLDFSRSWDWLGNEIVRNDSYKEPAYEFNGMIWGNLISYNVEKHCTEFLTALGPVELRFFHSEAIHG